MKSKKIAPLIIFLIIFFTLIYIILAAKPLGKEFQFTPEWKISVSAPAIDENKESKPTIYFKLGQSLGYFTEDGKVTLYESFPAIASISDYYYSIYSTNSTKIPFYNQKGELQGAIKTAGYPYFRDNNSYIFLPGGNSFSKVLYNGDTAWTYEGTLPITAFASSQKYTAAGFADGKIKLFDNSDGSTAIDFAPGGSDYPVILGLDISSDGNYIASVSGHEQQRFVLSQKENNQQKIIFHYFISESSPYRTLVHFTEDNSRVFYLFEGNLGIYNIATEKNYIIPISDRIINIEESEDFVFLLGKTKSQYTVYMIDKTNTLEGKFSFTADTAFMKAFNNNLYIGNNTSISKISLSRG